MNRKELIDALATKTGSTKADAERNIAALIEGHLYKLPGNIFRFCQRDAAVKRYWTVQSQTSNLR